MPDVVIRAIAIGSLAVAAVTATGGTAAIVGGPKDLGPVPAQADGRVAFLEPIDEAATAIEMVPVPGSADGSIKPFWIARTEIPWEVFDVFLYRLDLDDLDESEKWADTESRPSKPYLPPDRGFGHQGYATISVTHRAAAGFCAWMTERTGRTWRLPTEDEWEHAARVQPDGSTVDTAYAFGDAIDQLSANVWFKGNSRGTPHPVGTRPATPLGLHDMHGNVVEWVDGRDGKPTTKGGSYRDTPKNLRIDARKNQTPAWNSTDPQLPKSRWWLSDGPFVGFRVICETAPTAPKAADAATESKEASP